MKDRADSAKMKSSARLHHAPAPERESRGRTTRSEARSPGDTAAPELRRPA